MWIKIETINWFAQSNFFVTGRHIVSVTQSWDSKRWLQITLHWRNGGQTKLILTFYRYFSSFSGWSFCNWNFISSVILNLEKRAIIHNLKWTLIPRLRPHRGCQRMPHLILVIIAVKKGSNTSTLLWLRVLRIKKIPGVHLYLKNTSVLYPSYPDNIWRKTFCLFLYKLI